jgi:hypothetical protein
LATALAARVTALYTYDDKLLRTIAGDPPMRIEKPPTPPPPPPSKPTLFGEQDQTEGADTDEADD